MHHFVSTVKIYLLYVPRNDLVIDRLLNEGLNEDNRRILVLLILSLRFGDNLDPPDLLVLLPKFSSIPIHETNVNEKFSLIE